MRKHAFNFVGAKLKEARSVRGFQQNELADKLDVSRQSINQYENGVLSPSKETFDKLVEILKLPAIFFLREELDYFGGAPILYRSLKSAKLTDKTRAETYLQWYSRLTAFAEEFVEFPPLNLPPELFELLPTDPRKLTFREIDAVALQVRMHWNLQQYPIPHVIRTLERNGFIVCSLDFDAPSIDALSAWSAYLKKPFMLLNRDKSSAVRARLTAAHELGELLLHRYIDKDLLANKEYVNLLDEQANRFAGAFLLPEEAFLNDLTSLSVERLLELKRKWKVSLAMMIVRLKRLGMIDKNGSCEFLQKLFTAWLEAC